MKAMNNSKGFTLMEIIISIAILSIVVMVIFRLMDFGVSSFDYGKEYADEGAQLRQVALEVTQEIRNGFKVDFTGDGTTTGFSKLTGISANSIYATNLTDGVVKDTDGGSAVSMSNEDIVNIRFAPVAYHDKVAVKISIIGVNETYDTEVLLNNITVFGADGDDGVDMLASKLNMDKNSLTWYERIWYTQDKDQRD